MPKPLDAGDAALQIAYHGADKDLGGKVAVDDSDCFEGPAARLIKACMAYVTGAAARMISERFGDGPVDGKIQAHVITAVY